MTRKRGVRVAEGDTVFVGEDVAVELGTIVGVDVSIGVTEDEAVSVAVIVFVESARVDCAVEAGEHAASSTSSVHLVHAGRNIQPSPYGPIEISCCTAAHYSELREKSETGRPMTLRRFSA